MWRVKRWPTTRRVFSGRYLLAIIAISVLQSCASSTTQPRGVTDHNRQVAGGVLRVFVGRTALDLRIARMSPRSDAGGEPPSCLSRAGSVQFGLNWQAVRARAAAPRVAITLASASGSPLTIGATGSGCAVADHYVFDAMPAGSQLVLSGALPSTDDNVSALRVTIDGVSATVPLAPTCSAAQLSKAYTERRHPCADDPMTFDPANGYSATLRD